MPPRPLVRLLPQRRVSGVSVTSLPPRSSPWHSMHSDTLCTRYRPRSIAAGSPSGTCNCRRRDGVRRGDALVRGVEHVADERGRRRRRRDRRRRGEISAHASLGASCDYRSQMTMDEAVATRRQARCVPADDTTTVRTCMPRRTSRRVADGSRADLRHPVSVGRMRLSGCGRGSPRPVQRNRIGCTGRPTDPFSTAVRRYNSPCFDCSSPAAPSTRSTTRSAGRCSSRTRTSTRCCGWDAAGCRWRSRR